MEWVTKRDWIDALRSGKYKQAKGKLRIAAEGGVEEGYCCLGVLGDILGCKWELDRGASWYKLYSSHATLYASSALPPEVADPICLSNLEQHDLMYMNDSGKSFEEIADWIDDEIPAEMCEGKGKVSER